MTSETERSGREGLGGGQIVVLGMHRSGTSATTALINSLGAFVGPEGELTGSGPENPRGFFERRDLRKICDSFLHTMGADWWKVADLETANLSEDVLTEKSGEIIQIFGELDKHGTWVIKEPRLCFLLPLFRRFLRDAVVVFVARNPLEVAQSLRRRNGFPRVVGLALWEAYCIAALRHSSGMPRIIVNYDDLVKNPTKSTRTLYQRLKEMGVPGLALPEVTAIDLALYRERSNERAFVELASAEQQSLWSAIRGRTSEAIQAPSSVSTSAHAILQDFQEDQMARCSGAQKAEKRPATPIDLEGFDFLDFGCSDGGSMDFARRALGGQRGLGLDLSPAKVAKSISRGNEARVADITIARFVGNVRFVLMSHFLEHLRDIEQARLCIEAAVRCAREYVLIQQPYFDADGYLFERGLKLAWSDWRGHPNHVTAVQFHSIASRLLAQRKITNFIIGRRMRIMDSDDASVHPLQSPPNQQLWVAGVHPAKPATSFDFLVFRELFVMIGLGADASRAQELQTYMRKRDAQILFESQSSANALEDLGPEARR
jgi:hypothetical protein